MKPLVSVIIPVYNGAAYLGEAIESALAQDYDCLEIIVADDASSDDSVEVARSFPGVTVLVLQHGGVSVTRNAAVAASKGEMLAFLDSDDLWFPGKISAQVALAERFPGAGIFLCERIHKFEEVPTWYVWPTEPQIPKICFEPSAWLVRRSTFEEVGPFEPGRALGEDLNWLMRAWSMGCSHRIVQEVQLVRRIHGSNASAALPSVEMQTMSLLRESIAIKRAMSEPAADTTK